MAVTAAQVSDLSVGEAEELGATIGALIGLGFEGEDGMEAGALIAAEAGADGHLVPDAEMSDVADTIPAGSAAALALIEHVWAGPLRDAIARAGGTPVSDAWVHPLDLVARRPRTRMAECRVHVDLGVRNPCRSACAAR